MVVSTYHMRKDEYLHLHALFVELRHHLQQTGDVPADAFAAYDAYDVTPVGCHRRKDRHHKALIRLRDGVQRTIAARHQMAPNASEQAVTADPPTN